MNKKAYQITSAGKTQIERSQLDWDIEDARYELLGTTEEERRTRKERINARSRYAINLKISIIHALKES